MVTDDRLDRNQSVIVGVPYGISRRAWSRWLRLRKEEEEEELTAEPLSARRNTAEFHRVDSAPLRLRG
jgi:hypothetical protein